MIDSASSPSSFSQSRMCSSMCFISPTPMPSFWMISRSRSNILIAYQRIDRAGTLPCIDSSMCAIACSTDPLKTCGTSGVLPGPLSTEPFFARTTALSAASTSPSFFSADMPITSQPRAFEIFAKSILSPFFLTTSIMLTAITIGSPSSASCVERYRLRSMFVPSTMFSIASGVSSTRKFRDTFSSMEYGESE